MKCPIQVFSFSIQNASNDEVDIYIDGAIVDAETQEILKSWFGDETSVSFKSFRTQLNAVDAKVYNIFINSPGGSVTDAMAMHDYIIALRAKGKKVNTKGMGLIASAGTYILMAGDSPEMSKNSWMMIHNVSGAIWGDVNEIENYAGTLRKFNDSSRDFYATFTGQRKEDITKMMNNETWMTAAEAKEKGFVKQVTGDASFKNSISPDIWNISNRTVLNAYNASVKPEAPGSDREYFKSEIDNMQKFFQNIVDAIKGTKPANDATSITGEQIAAAVQKPFEDAAAEIENQVAAQVTAQVNTAVTAAVKPAVDAAVAPLNTRITELETTNAALVKKNGELETEITNIKGGQTEKPEGSGEGKKVIGQFNKQAKTA